MRSAVALCYGALGAGNVTVTDGYLKITTVTGGAPPATECNDMSEAERLVRTDGPPNIYVCTGRAWVGS